MVPGVAVWEMMVSYNSIVWYGISYGVVIQYTVVRSSMVWYSKSISTR